MNTNISRAPVNRIIYIASNVINIIMSFMLAVFTGLLLFICDQNKAKNEISTFIIPLLLAITLKFVFGIINGRNISQFNIVQNGLLFLILNIFLIVLYFVLLLLVGQFDKIKFDSGSLAVLVIIAIISFLCLIVAIFTIVERVRKKNDIHLFFLIFYTFLILLLCVACVISLVKY